MLYTIIRSFKLQKIKILQIILLKKSNSDKPICLRNKFLSAKKKLPRFSGVFKDLGLFFTGTGREI